MTRRTKASQGSPSFVLRVQHLEDLKVRPEAACGAPQEPGLQAAAAAAAAALELAQAAHQTALQQQALTREGKLKGARTGGEDDFRVKEAAVDLQAKEQAHESAVQFDLLETCLI